MPGCGNAAASVRWLRCRLRLALRRGDGSVPSVRAARERSRSPLLGDAIVENVNRSPDRCVFSRTACISDVEAADTCTEFASWKAFLDDSPATGRAFVESWIWPHTVTAWHASKLMVKHRSALIVELVEQDNVGFHGAFTPPMQRAAVLRDPDVQQMLVWLRERFEASDGIGADDCNRHRSRVVPKERHRPRRSYLANKAPRLRGTRLHRAAPEFNLQDVSHD
jgi:hypothetical protein